MLRRAARHSATPWVVLAACLLAAPAAVDVGVADAAAYALYELLVVVAPGVALLTLLCPAPRGWAWRLGVGWALGLTLEVVIFVGTAILDVPGAHAPACVAIGLVAGAIALIRRRGRSQPAAAPVQRAWSRWAAAAAATVLAFVTLVGFASSPLPGTEPVSYDPDVAFAISMAAEAKNHWPVTDPKVAGQEFPYHTFVYFHLAGASRATGIELSTVYLRLYIGPLVLLACLLLAELARRLGPGRATGAVAIALAFLIGELDLVPGRQGIFLNFVFFDLFVSPTFVLGLVIFLGLLLVCFDGLERSGRERAGRLAAALLLAAGCAGAKGSILPMLGFSVAIFLLTWRIKAGRWRRDAAVLLGGVSAIWLAFFIWWYDGGRVGATLDPLGAVRDLPIVNGALDGIAGSTVGEPIYLAIVTPLVLLGLCGVVCAGVVMALRLQPIDARRWALACLFATTLVPFVLLFHPGASQMFFVYYGLLAACPLAAQGLIAGFARWRRARPGDLAPVALALVVFGVALAMQEIVPAVGELGGWATWRWYLALGVAVGALTLLAWRNAWRARTTWVATAVGVLLVTAMADHPFDHLTPMARRLEAGRGPQDQSFVPLTPDLERGLLWLRAHTTPDDVVASNAAYIDAAQQQPILVRVSAFAERRTFLEGWTQTIRNSELAAEDYDLPLSERRLAFPDRLALNRRAFLLGSANALDELQRRGVRLLWVEKNNGPASPKLARRAKLVYENAECAIYAL